MKHILLLLAAYFLSFYSSHSFTQKEYREIKISKEYIEGCETGIGDCKTIVIEREKDELLYLTIPKGGTSTSVSLFKYDHKDHINVIHEKAIKSYNNLKAQENRFPKFNLSELDDDKYLILIFSCNLAGMFEFDLITK